MNLDSFQVKGHTHEVCQDYAMTHSQNGVAVAVLCDGCSASPGVDLGAQILARSAIFGLITNSPTRRDTPDDTNYFMDFGTDTIKGQAMCQYR